MAVPKKKLRKNKTATSSRKRAQRPSVKLPPGEKLRTGADLMKHWGTWVGDDIDQLLDEVIASRSLSKF